MVVATQRDGQTWHRCEKCGMLFGDRGEADRHESTCDAEEPAYIQ